MRPAAPTFETDADAVQRALDDRPADRGLRLVLADVYDERGDSLGADGLRWMAAKGRLPVWTGTGYAWATYSIGNDDFSELPPPLYRALDGQVDPDFRFGELTGSLWCWWPTVRAAQDGLLAAWRALDEAGRAACWEWEDRPC